MHRVGRAATPVCELLRTKRSVTCEGPTIEQNLAASQPLHVLSTSAWAPHFQQNSSALLRSKTATLGVAETILVPRGIVWPDASFSLTYSPLPDSAVVLTVTALPLSSGYMFGMIVAGELRSTELSNHLEVGA